jgi:hemerythrin-like domain-containing protein
LKAVEILVEEHTLILEFLATFGRGVEKIESENPPDSAFFDRSLEFCRGFADKAHHYKEEHVMFGLLAQKHDGKLDGLISSHRDQHEQCRNLIQNMAGSLPGYARGEEEARRNLFAAGSTYVRTLRSHIASENDIFFPMAISTLTGDEGEALLTEFKRYEAKAGVDMWGDGPALVEELGSML